MTAAPRRHLRAALTFLGAALSAGAMVSASAQTAPAQKPSESVVVTGQKPLSDDALNAVVSQFIDLHAAKNRKTGQYMRDDAGPLCPVTLGLPPAFDAFVTRRILSVAASVGARTDASGTCRANVEILFTDQPQQLVKSLSDRTRGAILGMHFNHERPRYLEVTHPIQGWYVTGTRYDENTIEPVTSTAPDGSTKPTNDRAIAYDDAYWNAPERVVLGSKIPVRRVSAIANVLIVADMKTMAGREIGPVADYITMLSLSQPRSLDECNDLPSILDLLSDGCDGRPKPQALTDSDMAYLKGLYAADLGATTVSVQKSSIANGMKGNLVDPAQADSSAEKKPAGQ